MVVTLHLLFLLRPTKGVDINYGLCKGFRSFLGQIVPDASRDIPVRILAREFLGVAPDPDAVRQYHRLPC